jgi:hypothetical protein
MCLFGSLRVFKIGEWKWVRVVAQTRLRFWGNVISKVPEHRVL